MSSISARELQKLLSTEQPNHSDPYNGFALVNVLTPEVFLSEHIPGSVNIPQASLYEFEKRFQHSKPIILYCASKDCPASEQVAEELAKRGFSDVKTFPGGMAEWSERNYDIESGERSAQEMNIA
ncbi:MAG: rhodanese-like domain-containing protein [Deltaproteobacteria bacterium]|nr:rhodanese-like domain-containing protein [Deltaproteobacteria bacterium]